MLTLLIKIWHHFSPVRKKQFLLLPFFVFIVSSAEVLTISAVLPFLSVLAAPEVVFESPYSRPLINFLNLSNPTDLVLPISIIFAIVAIFTGIIRVSFIWFQTRFVEWVGKDISYEMYVRTIHQPFIVHINRNSSEVISAVSTKANQTASNIIHPLITIFASVFILISIAIVLFFISPLISAIAFSGFLIIYSIFYFISKNKIRSNGIKISSYQNKVILLIQEGLSSIRNIIIDNAYRTFYKEFSKYNSSLRRHIANNQIIGQIPKYGIESATIVLFCMVAIFFDQSKSYNSINVFTSLMALGVAAQRMLPLMHQIYNSWVQVRGAEQILKDALDLLEQPYIKNETIIKGIEFNNLIKLNNICFSYDNNEFVLKNVNFELNKKDVVGLIGPSGSGKSTFLDLFMGLLQPNEGYFFVDGIKIDATNISSWQNIISHIPQEIFLSDTTIKNNIAFGIPNELIDEERVMWAANAAALPDVISKFPKGMETLVGERGAFLSGGQKQRIGIARALYKRASILILDEATSALDFTTENKVIKNLLQLDESITIILVTHRLSTLKFCNKVYQINNKKLITYPH